MDELPEINASDLALLAAPIYAALRQIDAGNGAEHKRDDVTLMNDAIAEARKLNAVAFYSTQVQHA